MTFLSGQVLAQNAERRYHVEIPADPVQERVPAIVVFHGGGQDVATIAGRWGVIPGTPTPAPLADYLLVFPEAHPLLNREWVHFQTGDSGFPTLDLDFVTALLAELRTRSYPTGSAAVPGVSADPDRIYVAGFSNGAGMVWQLLNSDVSAEIRGYAAVGKVLDPEKADHYRSRLAAVGGTPAAAPVAYLQGTADHGFRPTFSAQESPLEETLPFFTLPQMLTRNDVPPGPAATTLVPGSDNVTEVVLQLFVGTAAYLHGTVVNGGHNWPTPTSRGNPPVADHFDATRTIVEFWQAHAGL